MKGLETDLRDAIQGEIRFDPLSRKVYSVDASIFEFEPIGIVIPKHLEDLRNAVEIARHYQVPIIPRGAATGITGGCLGRGLIIDLSKSINQILEVNCEKRYAVCEPGVVQDDLNRRLEPDGFRLGPDTSTGNRATLGGMLANNSAGAHSLRFGKMSDHVLEVELLLSGGEKIAFSKVTEEEWRNKGEGAGREGEIYRTLWEIRKRDQEEIMNRFPNIPRRVSGYNLDELLKAPPFNVSKLIAGSEGTLGIATRIKMEIVPKLQSTGLLLLFFSDLLQALRAVPELLENHPISLELIDEQIIVLGRASPQMRGSLDWLQGNPKAFLVVELEAKTQKEIEEKIFSLLAAVKEKKIGYLQLPFLHPSQMAQIWNLRKSGLGILLSKRSYSRAIAFLEDLSLPPQRLAEFMEEFCGYLASIGKEAGIYGHAGAGCMHVRPYLNLRDPAELQLMHRMMEEISSMVLKFGGALSGEHGDGWIRSWLNPKMFGGRIMEAFHQVKTAFDPLLLMNPGKIVPSGEPWENLRERPGVQMQSPKTFLDFEPEGGFALSADLCNGNGLCRKKEKLMCPSFQATNDEFHSTRARAQALRAIIHERLPIEAFTAERMHDVMDLCLSCKGCKTECPSQIDMAKFKSEFLYHYQEAHGIDLRTRLFGNIGLLNAWMSHFPRFFNFINQNALVKKGLEWIGISSKRSLPPLAAERFSAWFKDHEQPMGLKNAVILLNDTFTEFNHPKVGIGAVKVLNGLGYRVILPPWRCCGRPALTKGLLVHAKKQAIALVGNLWQYSREGLPIIGLEPSCLLTLKDDYGALGMGDGREGGRLKRIQEKALTLDEFLAERVGERGGEIDFKEMFIDSTQRVKVHGHCHQKALVGMNPTLKLLRAIPGFIVEEIPSGCCGMAGSFGYEKEHEEISMKIGGLHLFPAVKNSSDEDWIIASGMSCRHQISDGTGREALHLAEALALRLKKDT